MVGDANPIVLFDAVGTLMYPCPGVVETYHAVGSRHGSRRTIEHVNSRFRQGRSRYFQTAVDDDPQPSSIQSFESSDQMERDLWLRLIEFVFDDLDGAELVTDELWHHFACPEHWKIFDDVHPCLQQLKRHGIRTGIASNFDSRLGPLCHDLLPEFEPRYIFWSSAIGFRKPDHRFYGAIATQLGPSSRVTMVGDDYLNDFVAPLEFGWQAYLLDRNRLEHEARQTIQNLSELPNIVLER